MAKLSAHGTELYRYEGILSTLSYRSDGYILRNHCGAGWKLWKRLKKEVNPQDHADRIRREHHESDRKTPCFVTLRHWLHKNIRKSDRALVVQALRLLSDDPDGLWSQLTDGWPRVDVSIEDCVTLCNLYGAYKVESDSLREQAVTVTK